MKVLQILIILLLCLDNQSVNASFNYTKGDSLHVWASSGLNMRDGPGTYFPKIKKLEYGDKVEVIDKYLRANPFQLTILKQNKRHDLFKLEGHWVRVKIGTQEGYVFDGYLSRFPIMEMKKAVDGEIFFEHFNDYAKREFGLDTTALNADSVANYRERYIYKNGMEWKDPQSECYFADLILGSNLSFNEAYLIFEKMTSFEFHAKFFKPQDSPFNTPGEPIEYDTLETKVIKGEDGKYYLSFNTDFFGMTLEWKDGKFIISEWGCC